MDPLEVIWATPEQELAFYLNKMPKSLVPVFQREFVRRPTQAPADSAAAPAKKENK